MTGFKDDICQINIMPAHIIYKLYVLYKYFAMFNDSNNVFLIIVNILSQLQ